MRSPLSDLWAVFGFRKYRHPATVCAWCSEVLTWVTTRSMKAPLISHGICATCDAKVNAELAALDPKAAA